MKKAFKFICHSYRGFRLLSLWRANSSRIKRIILYILNHFAAHEYWKHVLRNATYEESYFLQRYFFSFFQINFR